MSPALAVAVVVAAVVAAEGGGGAVVEARVVTKDAEDGADRDRETDSEH
jgi:hypothetical protein